MNQVRSEWGSVTQFISVLQLVKTQLAPGLCAARKKTNWKKQYRKTATDNLVCEGRFHCLHFGGRIERSPVQNTIRVLRTKAGGRTENPKYVTSSVTEIELPEYFRTDG